MVEGQGQKLTLFDMLYMGYSSPSVIALDYDFTFLYNFFDSIQCHTGGDMIAFVSESIRLVIIVLICSNKIKSYKIQILHKIHF